jgi:hypothetical protein
MIPPFLLLTSYYVLAQELPPPDTMHLSAWLVDAAALAAMLLVFLKVLDHFKRRPSLEQELEKLLRQIRAELNQIRVEHADHLAEISIDQRARLLLARPQPPWPAPRKGPPRGEARGDGFGRRDVRNFSSGVHPRMAVAVFCVVRLGRNGRFGHREFCVMDQGMRRKTSDNRRRAGSRFLQERQSGLPLSRKSPMRSTVSLSSEATKKMITPVEGETKGNACSVATKPAAFAT